MKLHIQVPGFDPQHTKGRERKTNTHIKYVMYIYQKVNETHPFVQGVQECMLVVITEKSKNTLIV